MARYLLDTNILLRASDPASANYRMAVKSVSQLLKEGNECVITAQVLIEFWVVATRPVEVNGLGWTPQKTQQPIRQLLSQFTLLEEIPGIFPNWLELVTTYNVMGKRTHDIRLLAVMKAHGITHLLTFNPEDFIKAPGLRILHPREIIQP